MSARIGELEQKIRVALLPKDAMDDRNVVLEIRAGTGGDEASLFAGDLFRMYERFANLQGWKVEVISASEGTVGGYKEIIAEVQGRGAFAKLKFESGVHRVQRVPDTETQGRIHTSAATVAVLPEVEDVDVDIKSDDLRIETMRAQGAGGQHVNKTESAIRITHIPTGIVVMMQDSRSQHKNRASAMNILRSRIYDAERQRIDAARSADRSEKVGSGDRSERIRTYNFPQGRVTDHRINLTLYKLPQVIAGEALGELIDALTTEHQAAQLAAARRFGVTETASFAGQTVEAARRALAARFRERGIDSAELDARLLAGAALGLDLTGLMTATTRIVTQHEPARLENFTHRRLGESRSPAFSASRSFGACPCNFRRQRWCQGRTPKPSSSWHGGLLAHRPVVISRCESSTSALGQVRSCWRYCPNYPALLASEPTSAWPHSGQQAAMLPGWGSRNGLHSWPVIIATALSSPFDLIVSNPPYIRSADIEGLATEVRDFDPLAALDGGADGLDAYRRIAPEAARLLAPGGALVMEVGQGQSSDVRDLMAAVGLRLWGRLKPIWQASKGRSPSKKGPDKALLGCKKSTWNIPRERLRSGQHQSRVTGPVGRYGSRPEFSQREPPGERFQNAGPFERDGLGKLRCFRPQSERKPDIALEKSRSKPVLVLAGGMT